MGEIVEFHGYVIQEDENTTSIYRTVDNWRNGVVTRIEPDMESARVWVAAESKAAKDLVANINKPRLSLPHLNRGENTMTQVIANKVYFTINGIALGTDDGPDTWYGDYYAAEYIAIPEGVKIVGETLEQIKFNVAGIERVDEANSALRQGHIHDAIADMRRHEDAYGMGRLTPEDYANSMRNTWMQCHYRIVNNLPRKV